MAKVRVYELAKELGVESKVLVTKLQEMGEFVRSASSTVEAPVVRKLREAYPVAAGNGAAPAPAAPPARKPAARKTHHSGRAGRRPRGTESRSSRPRRHPS